MLKYQNNVFKRGTAGGEEWIPSSILTCPRLSLFGSRRKTEYEKRDQREGEVWWEGGKRKGETPFLPPSHHPPRSPWPRFSLGGWETTSRDESAYCHTLLHATCTSPIMHLASPPKFCMTFFFSFLLGIAAVLREFENNTYANFWGANKVHYGRCASGVLADHSLRC